MRPGSVSTSAMTRSRVTNPTIAVISALREAHSTGSPCVVSEIHALWPCLIRAGFRLPSSPPAFGSSTAPPVHPNHDAPHDRSCSNQVSRLTVRCNGRPCMSDANLIGKSSLYLCISGLNGLGRAEADQLAREVAGQAGPAGRVRASREIVALITRTGYLSRLVAERLPDAEAVRYAAGAVALDRGWAPSLAAGVKELLAADVPGFRAEVAGCLAEELTRLAPAVMDLDLIACGDQGESVSACAWGASLVRSRSSGVWKTAIRQAVRAAKSTGGLVPADGGGLEPFAALEREAAFRPLWRGRPAACGSASGEVTEEDDSRTDDVCDSMKR